MKKLTILFLLMPLFGHSQYTVKSQIISGSRSVVITNYTEGHIIEASGQRMDGKIALKVINEDTVEVRYKSPSGSKIKFNRSSLQGFDIVRSLVSEVKNDYKNPIKNFHSGYIIFSSGKRKEGLVASVNQTLGTSDGSKANGPVNVKYAGQNNEIYEYPASSYKVTYYMQNIDGEEHHFKNVKGTYIEIENPNKVIEPKISIEEVLAAQKATEGTYYSIKLTKRSTSRTEVITHYHKGYVVDHSGNQRSGEIALSVYNGVLSEIRFRDPEGNKTNYDQSQVTDYGLVNYYLSEIKNDYKDPIQNFYPGYVILENGEKIEALVSAKKHGLGEGKGIIGPIGVRFANENEVVFEYLAKQHKVVYYMQNIDGEEQHFVNAQDMYIRVENPNGRFSYFQNPYPTHERKGASFVLKDVIRQTTEEVAENAAEKAAQKSVEKSIENGEGLVTTANNARIAAAGTYQGIISGVNYDHAKIYFKEYFLVDNKTGNSVIVYKRNIEDEVVKILEGCDVSTTSITNVENIELMMSEAVAFLEANICE
ncbi:hypothetical protein [Ekhidna sp.]|uniref:hypothetical protein n=1 Tax=Ekhidna sp. TaxID=2608089 RepID=UPI003298E10D